MPEDHFERLEGVSGFLYIARNPHHGEDVYKVGCTGLSSAQQRIDSLNKQYAKGKTAAVGFYELCYDADTLNARGAEKLAHAALKNYSIRNAGATEFFKAPIHDIMAAIDVAVMTANGKQKTLNNAAKARALKKANPQAETEDQYDQAVSVLQSIARETARQAENKRQSDASAIIKQRVKKQAFEEARMQRDIEISKRAQQQELNQPKTIPLRAIDLKPEKSINTQTSEQKKRQEVINEVYKLGAIGLLAALLGVAIFSKQENAAILPPPSNILPAAASPQTTSAQTPPAAPIPIAIAHADPGISNIVSKRQPNKPSKKASQDAVSVNTVSAKGKTENDSFSAYATGTQHSPRVTTESTIPSPNQILITEPQYIDSQGCRWVSSIEWKCK